MDRSKIVAIISGAIALILSIAYLTIVQLLDSRGPMIPAPQTQVPLNSVLSVKMQQSDNLTFSS